MAVIPGGSHPVPDGAKQSGADLALIQNLTEDDVRNQIKGQALLPWRSAHFTFFTDIIGGIGTAIWNGVNGFVNSIGDWASSFFNIGRKVSYGTVEIRDGQLDLSERADLLSPLLNYGSCFCAVPSGTDRVLDSPGTMPFDTILGYSHNVTLKSGGGLTLHEKGTWNIETHVTVSTYDFSGIAGSLNQQPHEIDVQVLKPDGSIHSHQVSRLADNAVVFSTVVGGTVQYIPSSNDLKTTVQVPDAGYSVQVVVTKSINGRGWAGGPAWTRLTVQNISSEYFEDRADGSEPSAGA